MALIGTISGSVGAGNALVSATAITGTLVVANTSTDFPVLASDTIFFVSGVQGAIVASLPGVAVFGGDLRVSGSSYFTDIDVTGHGAVIVQPYGTSPNQTGEVRFKELAANGGNYTALKAADSISANLVLTLPAEDGANGNILKTSGTGVTSFVDASSVVTGTLSLVSINASGDITGSNARLNGDLAVNGGDITTTAGTFNLVNAAAATVNFAGAATSLAIGSAGGSTTFAGNITGSNLQLNGDLAVNGGDLTSTASTFNLATGITSQLNVGGVTPIVEIGTFGGSSSTRLAYGQTASPAVKTVDIGTRGNAGSTTNVSIGSSTAGALGRITLNHDVALTTGNIIGAPGTGANVMTLVSSGNIIAKLDTDNSAPGHRFEVWDYLNAAKFSVSETGDAELTGNLLITGSAINTLTTTTFNLLTNALTGTLNIGSAATLLNFGSAISTGSFTGDLGIAGRTTLAGVLERMSNSNGSTGTVSFDLVAQSIFYINAPAGNITANFTNAPISNNNRVLTPTVILSQSAAPTAARIVSNVQIDGVAQTINWANGVTPTGNQGKQDVFGFSLIRSGSAWKVLGQMSTYG